MAVQLNQQPGPNQLSSFGRGGGGPGSGELMNTISRSNSLALNDGRNSSIPSASTKLERERLANAIGLLANSATNALLASGGVASGGLTSATTTFATTSILPLNLGGGNQSSAGTHMSGTTGANDTISSRSGIRDLLIGNETNNSTSRSRSKDGQLQLAHNLKLMNVSYEHFFSFCSTWTAWLPCCL